MVQREGETPSLEVGDELKCNEFTAHANDKLKIARGSWASAKGGQYLLNIQDKWMILLGLFCYDDGKYHC